MESFNHQNYNTKLNKLSSPDFLRLSSKFLSSVFFFFIILLCSSLFPFILNYMQLFSCKMGKNYMFLLCNGILVLIVKNSGLMGSSHQERNLNLQKAVDISAEKKTGVAEEKVMKKFKEEEEKEEEHDSLVMEKEERNLSLTVHDGENDEQEYQIDIIDEEKEIELSSAEEFNKKCEDFIRKMKEDIKFECRSQIISLMEQDGK